MLFLLLAIIFAVKEGKYKNMMLEIDEKSDMYIFIKTKYENAKMLSTVFLIIWIAIEIISIFLL